MEKLVLTERRNHGTEIIVGANEEPRMLGGDEELRFFNNAASVYMLAQILSKDNAGHVFNVV